MKRKKDKISHASQNYLIISSYYLKKDISSTFMSIKSPLLTHSYSTSLEHCYYDTILSRKNRFTISLWVRFGFALLSVHSFWMISFYNVDIVVSIQLSVSILYKICGITFITSKSSVLSLPTFLQYHYNKVKVAKKYFYHVLNMYYFSFIVFTILDTRIHFCDLTVADMP